MKRCGCRKDAEREACGTQSEQDGNLTYATILICTTMMISCGRNKNERNLIDGTIKLDNNTQKYNNNVAFSRGLYFEFVSTLTCNGFEHF